MTTAERTYTREEFITLLAADYGPHDLTAEDVMMAFVDHDTRHADWDTRCRAFATMVADVADRRRRAKAWADR